MFCNYFFNLSYRFLYYWFDLLLRNLSFLNLRFLHYLFYLLLRNLWFLNLRFLSNWFDLLLRNLCILIFWLWLFLSLCRIHDLIFFIFFFNLLHFLNNRLLRLRLLFWSRLYLNQIKINSITSFLFFGYYIMNSSS